jgi:hypothetical protein
MEDIMKTITQMTAVTVLAAGLMMFTQAAYATDTSHAIQLCDANPSCKMHWNRDNTIGIEVGGKVIECPKKNGPCSVITHTTPTNLGHAGENGNARPNGGNGGNTDGGGQVGGPG